MPSRCFHFVSRFCFPFPINLQINLPHLPGLLLCMIAATAMRDVHAMYLKSSFPNRLAYCKFNLFGVLRRKGCARILNVQYFLGHENPSALEKYDCQFPKFVRQSINISSLHFFCMVGVERSPVLRIEDLQDPVSFILEVCER
jgi:hypothetical protein